MEPDQTFTRRVCAVLLADVTGFSRLMGEDDERTAQAVHRLQTLAQGIVAEANGRAEPVAGDALFATFDSVVAAVGAALEIQRRIAGEEFGGTPLRVRMGVHVGDVLTREGRAFGDAINIAARLESLAKPGTVCISDTVYRQVRNRFDAHVVDLGFQRLKNISDPVHAYLLDPSAAAAAAARPSGARMRWTASAAGLLVLALLVAGGVYLWRTTPVATRETLANATPAEAPQAAAAPADAGPVALGVMLFKSQAKGAEDDWRREALRDGLNAQLSQLSQVKVYSKEFLDFLITRKGLSEIEAATQLGIKKMLSGSFLQSGDTLQIETHVVDVASGVLDVSYTITARESEFLEMQNTLALEVVARLNLPVTEEEKRTLLARRNTNEDALKLLLESEHGAAREPGAPAPKPAAMGPRSSLQRLVVLGRLFGPRPAFADEAEAAIRELIERYREATQAGQIPALEALYAEFSPQQRAAQERYLESVRELKVTIDNVDIAVVGDEAVVSYTRTDDFVDAKTGRPMHVAVRLTKTLLREDDGWKMAAGK